MTRFEDNLSPYLTLVEQGSDPTTPASGDELLYAKAGGVYVRNHAGAVTGPFGAAGGGGEMDYAQITTPVTVTAATEAGADTIVTGAAVVYDGSTTVMLTFFCPNAVVLATHNIEILLYDGASDLGVLGIVAAGSVIVSGPVTVTRRLTPTAATHTYHVKACVDASAATVNAGAGGIPNYPPAFLRITKA
jgi:hypothetical protein